MIKEFISHDSDFFFSHKKQELQYKPQFWEKNFLEGLDVMMFLTCNPEIYPSL